MDFSTEEKARIAFALCYPGSIIIVGNVNYNSVFNDRLKGLNSFIIDQANSLLSQIDAIDLKLNSSPNKSNVKRIGDIELDTEKSFDLLRKESNRLRSRLSSLLDIPNMCRGSSCMVNVCQ